MRNQIFIVGVYCLVQGIGISVMAEPPSFNQINQLTRSTKWEPVQAIEFKFDSFHPQGMVKIGNEYFISSVKIITATKKYDQLKAGYDRDVGEGIGYLFKVSAEGELLKAIELGSADMYHPGGIDFDGQFIWVPVAEYRPNSQSIIYKVDPVTMETQEVLHFKDHIGGVVHNTDNHTLYAVSWGSRRFYEWALSDENTIVQSHSTAIANPSQYIDYQDCQYIGHNQMLCGGLNNYNSPQHETPFRLGGIEIVDLKRKNPVWQVPMELWSASGLPMTQNPFYMENINKKLRAYFLPEDNHSTLFIYEPVY